MSDAALAATPRARTRTLVWTDRAVVCLISILIFAPTMLFAVSLRPVMALVEIVGCVGALALVVHRRQGAEPGMLDAALAPRWLAFWIALAGLLLIAGGALHVVFTPPDWRIRDAVLADIALRGFALLYQYDGADYLLRAPLGMYMAPGLVGQAFGLTAAHVAMFVQNSVLLGSILYMFGRIGLGWRHVVVLLLFSGFVLLGVWIYYALSDKTLLDHMMKYGFDSWNPYFQYSSSLVQLYWVPNHALPAWWLAALLIMQARRQVDSATVGATLAGAMFWSPLVVLPVALWLVVRAPFDWRGVLLSRRTWLVAALAPCFLPVALYMVLGASSIAHGVTAAQPMFAVIYTVFMIAHLVHAAYILAYRDTLPRYLIALLIFNVAVLLALPIYNFGPANDLVMRGSIAPLTILAFAFGAVMLAPENARRRPYWVGLALVVCCAPSAFFEFVRPFNNTRYSISDCSLFEASAALGDVGVPANYAVGLTSVPNWLIDLTTAPRKPLSDRGCWSDDAELKKARDAKR